MHFNSIKENMLMQVQRESQAHRLKWDWSAPRSGQYRLQLNLAARVKGCDTSLTMFPTEKTVIASVRVKMIKIKIKVN